MKLWLKYVSILIKSQLQYRTSFIFICVGQFFIPFTVFISVYFLFDRFSSVKDYTFYEVALCYSVIHFGFSISECFARGFDMFSGLIRDAGFDRLMLRPRNLILQVTGSSFELNRIGRFLQSAIVMAIALFGLDLTWTPVKILLLFCMVLSSSLVFSGIFILTSTLCFWTVQSIEVVNIFTDGGRELSQFPLDIYKREFALFFTFIIPLGMTNYIPLMYILDRVPQLSILYVLAPLYGAAFIVPCVFIWYCGVRRYKSTGS